MRRLTFAAVGLAAITFMINDNVAEAAMLNGIAAQSALTGHTATGQDAHGKAFVKTFAEDGTVRVRGFRVGTWSVTNGGELCEQSGNRAAACAALAKSGDTFTAQRDGTLVMTFTLD